MPEIFFISGVARSGNTLLAAMLSQHPKISISKKTSVRRMADQMEQLKDSFECRQGFTGKDFARALQKLKGTKVEANEILGLNASLIAELTADATEKTLKGEKVPGMLGHLESLKLLFPSARFIIMVRDPRANVASLRKNQGVRIAYAANIWRKLNILALYYRFLWGSKNVFLLRFEDLLGNPEKVSREICKFLEVEFDAEMLNLSQSAHAQAENAYIKPEFDGAMVNNWKKELQNADIERIERITADLLQYWNYEAITPAGNKKPGLSPIREFWEAILLNLLSLRRAKFRGMDGMAYIPVSIPFKKRLFNFLHNTLKLLFSPHVVRMILFRQNKYLSIIR